MHFNITNPNTQYLDKKTKLEEGVLPYGYKNISSILRKQREDGVITSMDELLISQYYWAKQDYETKKEAIIRAIEQDEYKPDSSSPEILRFYRRTITKEAAKFLHMCSLKALALVVNKTALTSTYSSETLILDQELAKASGEIDSDNPKAELLKKANYRLKVVC